MNNKGMTLVELLVTFSLLLVLVIGMFNLILEVKFQLDEKQIAKDLTEYSSVINNDIHYDLLRNKPFAIAYKNKSSDNWVCNANKEETCNGNTAGYTFKPEDFTTGITKSTTELNDSCNNIYPCAVYAYVSGSTIEFKTIALNEATKNITNTTKEDDKKLLSKHGIYYDGVYESIPDQEFIEVKGEFIMDSNGKLIKNPGEKLEIKIENGLFIINFPVCIIENDKNYGFKIAYPFVKQEER